MGAFMTVVRGCPVPETGFNILTNGLHVANVNKSYKAILTAGGGSAPYAWTVASGQLPPGLSLDRTSGQITGTPTQAGQFSVTVGVSDSTRSSTSKAFALQVFELAQDQYGGFQSLPVRMDGSRISILRRSDRGGICARRPAMPSG